MTEHEERQLHEESDAFTDAPGGPDVFCPATMRYGARLARQLKGAILARLEVEPHQTRSLMRAANVSVANLDEAIAIYDRLADEAEARH